MKALVNLLCLYGHILENLLIVCQTYSLYLGAHYTGYSRYKFYFIIIIIYIIIIYNFILYLYLGEHGGFNPHEH